jgi:hypothetical protein
MIAEAGAGALREVTGAFREIATKLGEFADEIMAKFRGEAGAVEKDAAGTVEKDAASTVEKDAASTAEKDGASAAEKEAQKAEELVEAIEISKGIATAEDAGHIPGPAIAVSLDALESRYRWIKTFEARPAGSRYEIYLIASEHYLQTVGSPGEPGKPVSSEELLARARALPEQVEAAASRARGLPEEFPVRQKLLDGVEGLSGDAKAIKNLAESNPEGIGHLQSDIEKLENELSNIERQLDDAGHAAEHGVAPKVRRQGNIFSAVDPSTGETIGVLEMDADGYMNLGVYTKDAQSELRGNQVLSALRKAAEEEGVSIRGMRGLWYGGDNLASFNAAILAGASPEEAAFETFTGKMAKRYEYPNVRIDYARSVRNPDGTFAKAELWFD